METLYYVRFTGRLQAGLSHEDVVTNLINLTNLDREKAESLLSSGKAHVLKKDADLETAEQYRTTFEKAGMVMQVDRMNATVPPLPALAKAETVQYSTLATDNSAPPGRPAGKKRNDSTHIRDTKIKFGNAQRKHIRPRQRSRNTGWCKRLELGSFSFKLDMGNRQQNLDRSFGYDSLCRIYNGNCPWRQRSRMGMAK